MFLWKAFQQIFIAGLIVLGLYLVLFATAFFFPPIVWVTTLQPGMLLAEKLFSVTPASFEWLAGDADDVPLVFAVASIILSFLFWWLCALLLLLTRVFWRTKRTLS